MLNARKVLTLRGASYLIPGVRFSIFVFAFLVFGFVWRAPLAHVFVLGSFCHFSVLLFGFPFLFPGVAAGMLPKDHRQASPDHRTTPEP